MNEDWGGRIALFIGIGCVIVGLCLVHHLPPDRIGALLTVYGISFVVHAIASLFLPPPSKIINWFEKRKKIRK